MHIARGYMVIRNERVLGFDGTVVEIEEALRLPVAVHIAAVRSVVDDLTSFCLGSSSFLVFSGFQRFSAVCLALGGDIGDRCAHELLLVLSLVCIGLKMGGVRVEGFPGD